MSWFNQLVGLLRQKGDSPVITEAKASIAEATRVDEYSKRMLRDKEASDWLTRDRPDDLAAMIDGARRDRRAG